MKLDKIHFKRNLKTIIEDNIVYVLPYNNFEIWNTDDKFSVKRAGSLLVIKDGIIIKNIMPVEENV